MAQGLEDMPFEDKQQLLRLLVERIVVEDGTINVETIIPNGSQNDKLRNLRGEHVEP